MAQVEEVAQPGAERHQRQQHEPTLRLKDSERDRAYVYVDALRELFALEGSDAATETTAPADVASLDEARRKQSRSA